MVVWPQRCRVLSDHAVPRPDVLFPPEGGQPPGLFISFVDHPFLGVDLHLYLGWPASSALHFSARLGAIPWDGVLCNVDCSKLGRNVERPAHTPRRLG